MEVRIYKDQGSFVDRKPVLSVRLSETEVMCFSYESCVRTFKSFYGVDCVIDFIVL